MELQIAKDYIKEFNGNIHYEDYGGESFSDGIFQFTAGILSNSWQDIQRADQFINKYSMLITMTVQVQPGLILSLDLMSKFAICKTVCIILQSKLKN